jgi:aspartate 1-decarboxylase
MQDRRIEVDVDAAEARNHKPRPVYLHEKNQIDRTSGDIPTHLASR